MAADFVPIKSNLLGIALVVRSKNGPQFVFHYPPKLMTKESQQRPRYGTELDPTTPDTSGDEGASDDNDIEDDVFGVHMSKHNGRWKRSHHVRQWDSDEHFDSVDGTQIVPWEHLDAFPTKELASILTPARPYHKKCFELTLDPLHFVTYPMHIREDGQWKKKKKPKKPKKAKQPAVGTEPESPNGTARDDMSEGQTDATELDEAEAADSANETVNGHGGAESENGIEEGGMTMFNLVFVLNPGRLEARAEVGNLFEHVAKDINKALRYAQNYSNYVWREADLILTMKDKAREKRRPMKSLWSKILEKSSLAAAIRDLHISISNNNIANVRFLSNPPVRLSVQIPKPYYLTVPPDNDEESMPGLWITTASCLGDGDGEDAGVLNKHFALLLLEDEDKIMAEIQADGGDLAVPLLEYLKILQPTSSFLQTAQAHTISLSDIRLLAQHLIYYRRAIAIPPLHFRDTYILSPNTDNHLLPSATAAWSKAFPLAPPLPTFLANISSAPRPYKTFAPSRPHRPIYMCMLAWLLRNGWVTQLRIFAWVIVWPEIRYEVEYALDAERIRAAYQDAIVDAIEEAQADAVASSSSPTTTTFANSPTSIIDAASTTSTSTTHNTSQPSASPSTPSSESIAERARLQRLREKAKQDNLAFNRRPRPVRTAHPSTNNLPHVLALPPKIIQDPRRANHVDSLYLEAISKRFEDERSRRLWMRFVAYFDGHTAVEEVGLREGLRRKEAWGLVGGWEEYLLVVRRW